MTNRERLFAILDGKPVDRVPIWLLFPYHQVNYYTDVRSNPCYTAIYEASKEQAIILDRRHMGASMFTPEVTIRREDTTEDGARIQRQCWKYRSTELVSETRTAHDGVTQKHLLSNENDLLAFAEFPINTDEKSIYKELDKRLPAYLREQAEFPEAYGSMMLDLGEPVGTLYHSANLLEYPIWSVTQNDAVKKLLDRHMEYLRILYRYTLEHNLADIYFLVGSELASPPMVSRDTFQQWIVPYAKEIIAMIHSYGRKVIQHYHGQIKEILPDFLTMAPDGLHTIEAPPVGNCTLTEAFEVTQNKIALIGNIQYDCFRSYTEDEMRAEVRSVIDEAEGRRLILSPSAGPYEHTISDQMRRNYLAFMQEGWDYGAKRGGGI